jgi:hypothetical protein
VALEHDGFRMGSEERTLASISEPTGELKYRNTKHRYMAPALRSLNTHIVPGACHSRYPWAGVYVSMELVAPDPDLQHSVQKTGMHVGSAL